MHSMHHSVSLNAFGRNNLMNPVNPIQRCLKTLTVSCFFNAEAKRCILEILGKTPLYDLLLNLEFTAS